MQRRQLLLSTAAAAALAASGPAALAQDSAPAAQTLPQPLHIVVPFAPGGPVDVTARILAEHLHTVQGITTVVENRPGGGGNIGVQHVARAVPDGRTLGIATTATHAVNPWLFGKLPFNPASDFAPITQMVRVPNVLVMNAERARTRGIRTVADLVAYAKTHPGQLNYGSGGNGSAGHLAGEMFKRGAGFFAVHIPYRGASPAQLALLAGEVDFNIDNLAAAASNIQSGKLIALAVTTPTASPLLPGVPPLANTVPGLAIDTWWGLVAPQGTPAAVVQQLHTAFDAALRAETTARRFTSLMAEPAPSTPQAFATFMQAERDKYQHVVRTSGAKVD